MTDKHMVSFSAIHEFFKNNSSQPKKGELSYNSGHVAKLIYDPSVHPPVVKGEVFASMKKKKYAVELTLNSEGSIMDMTCVCPRGQGVCHHMAALAFYCHYNISVTDLSCSWIVRKVQDDAVKKMKDINKSYTFRATKRPASSEELDNVKKSLSDCHVVCYRWLLREELSEEFLDLIPSIEEIIFNEQYSMVDDKCQYFLNCCKITPGQITQVERKTVGQSNNENWHVTRKHRLTASKFGRVLDAIRRNSYPPSLFKSLLEMYSLDRVMAVQWGREHEKMAVEQFQNQTGLIYKPSGLWLDECGFLGASPDGLIGDDAILEVKCPYKTRNIPLRDSLQDPSYVVYYNDNNELVVNNSHNYYHQIQGQLYICKKQKCYLVVWTPSETKIFLIVRDETWRNNLTMLQNFYVNKFIPFISSMKTK